MLNDTVHAGRWVSPLKKSAGYELNDVGLCRNADFTQTKAIQDHYDCYDYRHYFM